MVSKRPLSAAVFDFHHPVHSLYMAYTDQLYMIASKIIILQEKNIFCSLIMVYKICKIAHNSNEVTF